jgi:hypothetical protein
MESGMFVNLPALQLVSLVGVVLVVVVSAE